MKRILVIGRSDGQTSALREAVVSALGEDGLGTKVIEPGVEDPLGEAVGHAAVVYLASSSASWVDEAVAAAHAPGVEVLVVVLPQGEGQEALERLRKDGVPYVVLRRPPLLEDLAIAERRLWIVPRDARLHVVEAAAVARAVRAAIDSEEQGRTIVLGEEVPSALALRRAAELRGVDARVVALWAPLVVLYCWLLRLLRREAPPLLVAGSG
jgi:hypothetical protein